MTTRLRRAAGALLATPIASTGLLLANAGAGAATSCVFRSPVQGVDSTGMCNWLIFDRFVYDDGDARYRLRYRLTA